jgi:hypothetical protein
MLDPELKSKINKLESILGRRTKQPSKRNRTDLLFDIHEKTGRSRYPQHEYSTSQRTNIYIDF